ncbi:hypothetical protein RJ640_001161 [Escallonia rubra]|uniref:Late embryogenesis abundant protein LEA-2 subgroup domain-containing protein n=1 Tax=Escallonia rubra TaxID=112253 RepID=A0AA88QLC1_9ASTE|nr:hypothetical protein RJ640_001161 [Escallonia rubra]
MAGLAAQNSNNGPAPPLSRALSRNQSSGQKNLTRHVSFSETHLKQPPQAQRAAADTEAQRPQGRCSSHCNMWCAWASLIVGTLVLFVLLAGVVFFAFLRSNLPEFHVQRLDIQKLNVTTTKNRDTLLTADFLFRINATNTNGKIGLSYSPLNVDVSAEDIRLGNTRLEEFYQKPHTSTELKVRTGVTKSAVDEAAAKELQDNFKQRVMVVDVIFRGTLTFVCNGHKVKGFAFKVACEDIAQSEIDSGFAPQCRVRISPFRFYFAVVEVSYSSGEGLGLSQTHAFLKPSEKNISQYLTELLAEHQKLGPFMQVLPICSRLLNQGPLLPPHSGFCFSDLAFAPPSDRV